MTDQTCASIPAARGVDHTRPAIPFTAATIAALAATLLAPSSAAADTFSIAAVDVATGKIGSAGASCVGPINQVGAFILSDIVPGVGVIHTQAAYVAGNQQRARARLLEGLPPEEIVAWLATNDVQGDSRSRQYGVVDLTRGGASAAFTGATCIDYKGHLTGTGYSIQGNILSGPEILQGMEAAFVGAEGELAERMMASLEAAQIVGADTRCAARGTSSRSAFIKVVRPGDGAATYLELVVPDSERDQDPIGLLREAFDAWRAAPTITPGPTLTPRPFPIAATATPTSTSPATPTDATATVTPTDAPTGAPPEPTASRTPGITPQAGRVVLHLPAALQGAAVSGSTTATHRGALQHHVQSRRRLAFD